MKEQPLIGTLDGLTPNPVPRITRGDGFTIVPRGGGRLEFRLTGRYADLAREASRETGTPPKLVIVAAILLALPGPA